MDPFPSHPALSEASTASWKDPSIETRQRSVEETLRACSQLRKAHIFLRASASQVASWRVRAGWSTVEPPLRWRA